MHGPQKRIKSVIIREAASHWEYLKRAFLKSIEPNEPSNYLALIEGTTVHIHEEMFKSRILSKRFVEIPV